MGLIPQVKCGRCDRTYSGLRSRCPYCGAHRHKKGKRTTDSDNSTWKLIIGVLLIVVLIAAVIVILVTSSNEKNADSGKDTGEDKHQVNNADDGSSGAGKEDDGEGDDKDAGGEGTGGEGEGQGTGEGEGNGEGTGDPNQTGGQGTGEGEGQTGADTPPATVIASAITVKSHYGTTAVDYSLQLGEVIHCTATITPSNCTSIPVWSSDNPSVVTVIPTDDTGLKADITGVGRGVCNITVTVDSLTYTFIARCSGQ